MIDYVDLKNYVKSNNSGFSKRTSEYLLSLLNKNEHRDNISKLQRLADHFKESEQ